MVSISNIQYLLHWVAAEGSYYDYNYVGDGEELAGI